MRGLHLIVSDIEKARAELVAKGVEVGEVFHFGAGGQEPGLHPERSNYGSYANFSDPDGNTWGAARGRPQLLVADAFGYFGRHELQDVGLESVLDAFGTGEV